MILMLGSIHMEPLRSELMLLQNIENHHIEKMFCLYEKYYDYANVDSFKTDLGNKDVILLIWDNEHIVGFTTIKKYCTYFNDKPIQVIFSGDTIMHHAHWGNPILSIAWLKYAGKVKAQYYDYPLFWFLIVKGHRTYRYLPVFSKKFYPTHKEKTPEYEQSLLDFLAKDMFGKYYIQQQGIIHYPQRGQLKEPWTKIPDTLGKRDEIKFFCERNSSYINGDELACLCELSESNLKPFSRRLFKEGIDKHLTII